MQIFLKILLFIAANVAGILSVSLINILFVKAGIYPNPQTDEQATRMRFWIFGIGMWVWIFCALVSTGYFFTQGKRSLWLLWAPLYGTALYVTGAILYHLA